MNSLIILLYISIVTVIIFIILIVAPFLFYFLNYIHISTYVLEFVDFILYAFVHFNLYVLNLNFNYVYFTHIRIWTIKF